MTTKAFIAAKKLFDSLPLTYIIPKERKNTILRHNTFSKRKNTCSCDEDLSEIVKIPNIYPIFTTAGKLGHGYYSSIPVTYVAWSNPSQLIPIIEVIEIPILYTSMIFKEKEKEIIDKSLSFTGQSLIIQAKKNIFPIDFNILSIIRCLALNKIIEYSKNNAIIYLSIFEEMPKILYGNSVTDVKERLSNLNNSNNFGIYHSKRVVPIVRKGELETSTLHCWTITKQDLNSQLGIDEKR
ncbi:hypothetical protein QEJ31_07910 [Pigmentibacter sp. JX0631]|uniref:hypothetical protein n=1 Tax=Pigmentibacter sp. JX0631 TaxID=2976982 RepID=UPI0024688080|nr:hypothetical protein [Pigmentibacter sp. JX0631]WGL61514.1 hypothetical protein QEJ31_07910 [Pigmentibacter sp. JX0631]